MDFLLKIVRKIGRGFKRIFIPFCIFLNFYKLSHVSKSGTRKNRIYVDITSIFFTKVITGIQRVESNVSKKLKEISSDYDVVNVYCNGMGYRFCDTGKIIDFCEGDIFFNLEHSFQNVPRHKKMFARLMKKNIKTVSFFHDLIPVLNPEFCVRRYSKDFTKYLKVVLQFSELICNSKSVADELKDWISKNSGMKVNPNLKISYSLLGCDFSHIRKKEDSPTKNGMLEFLTVSTVEPRKMYKQIILAFGLLWEKGTDANLRIVGRHGWKIEETVSLIENNKNFGKRLFWYKTGISDEELFELYESSSVVIFASQTEGFGLAVVEGAYFGKPLILRDIPVFREIAGDNAFYFSGYEPEDLANAIEEWIELYKKNENPDSSKIELRSWHQCTQEIYELLTDKKAVA